MNRTAAIRCARLFAAALALAGRGAAEPLPPAARPPIVGGLVPRPKTLTTRGGGVPLAAASCIVAADPALKPTAEALAEGLYRLNGVRLPVVTGPDAGRTGDIVMALTDAREDDERYALTVTDRAVCEGRTRRAVAWAASTLLQAVRQEGDRLLLPAMAVEDWPDLAYRGAMLDVARKWHPVEKLYELVELFAFYKIRYLQLHLNDHGLFTFGSARFPGLVSTRHYTLAELRALVAYADARGVGIIPELEMPGHSDAGKRVPAIFGGIDRQTGAATPTGYVNVNREDTVAACAALLEEVMDVFDTVDYVSIGADEVVHGAFAKYPNYDEFTARFPERPNPYLRFLEAMAAVARGRGRRLMLYGQRGPPDVVNMPWSGNHRELAKAGYDLVMHTTGSVTHHLTTFHPPPYNTILLYDGLKNGEVYRQDWKADPLIWTHLHGVHILSWQNWPFNHLPDLRKTMPAVVENAWNQERLATFLPFEAWRSNVWSAADARLDDLLFPVKLQADGLLNPRDIVFHRAMTVTLRSTLPGTIRLVAQKLDDANPPPLPTPESQTYGGPLTLTEPTVVYAALFDDAGRRIGWGTQRRFHPIEPRVMGAAYREADVRRALEAKGITATDATVPDAPRRGAQRHAQPADLGIAPAATFPLGRLTPNPSDAAVYFQGFLLVLAGTLDVPLAGAYTFLPRNGAEILVDGASVAFAGRDSEKPYGFPVHLDAGPHALVVLMKLGQRSPAVADYQGPGMAQPQPLDGLLRLLPEYAGAVTAAAGDLPPADPGRPTKPTPGD